ncbi:alpha/beta hydrolase family protein [Kordiimonas marina]|uniref:alpha/beta hydrolase family protein n=1 Tax=Kordiimonas marina TaxID=2872312 RepID=UPI001FF2BA6D|nr:prolyl oligopeptidase family serine peptidase [Kordiimonas marina]MCJ9427714.1 prolyl oligopeptidase family serine peptidase [Kordiimonas marina]
MKLFKRAAVCVTAATGLLFFTLSPSAMAQNAGKIGGAPDLSYPSFDSPKDIPPHAFVSSGSINAASLAPDGKHFLTVSYEMGNVKIHVEQTEPGDMEKHYLGVVPTKYYDSVYWASKDRLLIQLASWQLDRNWRWHRNVSLVSVDKTGANLQRLFNVDIRKDEAYVDSLVVDLLPKEPNYVLIEASKDGKHAPSVFKLDIYTGETTLVMEGRRHISRWLTDHDGNVRLGLGYSDDHINMVARKAGSDTWQELHDNDLFKSGRFFPLDFDFDGTHMFVRSAVANGRFAIYRFDLSTGKLSNKIFEDSDVDALGIELSPSRKRLQAVTYIRDKLQRKFFDPVYKHLYDMIDKALPGRSNYVLSRTPDDHMFLIYSVSDRYPGALYILDTTNGHMTVLGEMNNALNPAQLAPTVRVNYFSRDGLEIPAYMTAPLGVEPKNLPVVILPHGGPHERTDIEYEEVVQFIASRGYLVLQPNYRGSTGYSYEYQSLGDGQWGGTMQNDLEDAADYLVREGIAAKGRVCIMGRSAYSSYAALLGVMKSPDRFACAVAVSPVTDLKAYAKDVKNDDGKAAAERITGDRSSHILKSLSPIKLTEDLTRPVLLFHGDKDRVIPLKRFDKFEKALQKYGKKVTTIRSKDEGHGLHLPKARTKFYRALEKFLQANLGDGVVKPTAPKDKTTADAATADKAAKAESGK